MFGCETDRQMAKPTFQVSATPTANNDDLVCRISAQSREQVQQVGVWLCLGRIRGEWNQAAVIVEEEGTGVGGAILLHQAGVGFSGQRASALRSFGTSGKR